ncbi:MAG: hypothetical protein Q9227_002601 [Pyrenula ochraceoflavens]
MLPRRKFWVVLRTCLIAAVILILVIRFQPLLTYDPDDPVSPYQCSALIRKNPPSIADPSNFDHISDHDSMRLAPFLKDEKQILIKTYTISPTDSNREFKQDSLKRGFCTLTQFPHQNLITTHHVRQNGDEWQLESEFLPYHLVPTLLSRNFPQRAVDCLFRQLLLSISHLHAHGLAHLSLTLSSIDLTSRGIPKISSLPTAFFFGTSDPKYMHNTTLPPLNPAFAAPEALSTSDSTSTPVPYMAPAADIFSLATLYICMTLRRCPWKSPSLADLSFRTFAEDDALFVPTMRYPTPDELPKLPKGGRGPRTLLRFLPRETRKLIGRMLSLEPGERPSIDEVLREGWVRGIRACGWEQQGSLKGFLKAKREDEDIWEGWPFGYVDLINIRA